MTILVISLRQWQDLGAARLPNILPGLLFPLLHALRLAGARRHRAWFERHSEGQSVAWHLLRIATKAVGLRWGLFPGRPPLPYLLRVDYLVEGVLPPLCAQVRAALEGGKSKPSI